MTRYPRLYETLTGEAEKSLAADFSETRERLKRAARGHQAVRPLQRDLVAIQARRLRMEVGR